jgi:hypothetical protein
LSVLGILFDREKGGNKDNEFLSALISGSNGKEWNI